MASKILAPRAKLAGSDTCGYRQRAWMGRVATKIYVDIDAVRLYLAGKTI
jgi:hypothetical protein